MIGKIISAIFVLTMLIFSYTFLSMNLSMEPVEMRAIKNISEFSTKINHNIAPVFADNLRFNHNNISYFFEPSCSKVRKSSMGNAFKIFQDKMKVISFYEDITGEADIMVGCSDEFMEIGENSFAAGEGGPVRIINTTNFNIIQKGKILLYMDQECNLPVVELHELSHVFGFDHTTDPTEIMYNTSNCDQKITSNMIDLIRELYSIKALPDATFSEASTIKRGIYIDFNITIINKGLIGIGNISLTILADGKEIEKIDIEDLDIGYMKTLMATNIRLPSKKTETVDFIIDYESLVEEINEENNVLQMTIPNF